MRHLLTLAPLIVLGFAACASSDDPTGSKRAGVGTGRAGATSTGGAAGAAGDGPAGTLAGGSSPAGGASTVGGAASAAGAEPGGAAGAAGQAGTPGACPSERGSPMTKIELPSGRTFCIDNHETSQADYAAFLKDKSAWNPSFAPDACKAATRQPLLDVIGPENPYGHGCPASAYAPDDRPNHAVTCVSWCDALAYCAWAGKRLCQRTDGKPLKPEYNDASLEEAATPEVSEWHFVCTSGGKFKSTTGGEMPKGCDPPTISGTFLPDVDVTKATTCASPESAFATIGYTNGALAEWMAEPMTDEKLSRPMAITSPGRIGGTTEGCGRVASAAATAKAGVHGIRCCAD